MLLLTIYLCKKGFYTNVYTKNKYRKQLHVELYLRIRLLNIDHKTPDFVSNK